MTRVLLTGGSGFIASHILDVLLKHGHEVVTTVRSHDKAQQIRAIHPNTPTSKLDFRIVADMAKEGAFDEAVKIDGLEAVIHAASPFHYRFEDPKKDLIDPAVNGTIGILQAIKRNAPHVNRVVITSSFAAIMDHTKGTWPKHIYSEKDWNPVTIADVEANSSNGYRASKTFAERAAWDFLEKEKPNFTIATMNPSLVFGPVKPQLSSPSNLNTSNQRVRDLLQGAFQDKIPETGNFFWIDVRDLALAHVRAIERVDAANKRFFLAASAYCNRDIVNIVRKRFPEYEGKMPGEDVKGDGFPEGGIYGFDNSRAREVLGIEFRGLQESIVDLVRSLKEIGV